MFTFLNPLLLSGLGLVALPIIIYLINRQRIKEMEWAAMQFLLEIVEEQQRKIQLEEWLLLLLRCLMVIFVALALARPSFQTDSGFSFFGDDGDAVILVDSSYSMATRQGPTSRFDTAKKRAGTAVQGVPKGFGISLVKLTAHPETVIGSYSSDHELVEQTVSGLACDDLAGNTEKMMPHLTRLLKMSKSSSRAIFVVSDFQRKDWETPSDELRKQLTELTENKTKVIFVPVGDANEVNCSASGLTLVQGAVRDGQMGYFIGTVRNHSTQDVEDLPVDFVLDGQAMNSKTVSITAGQSVKVYFQQVINSVGPHRAMLKIGQDANPADNQFYLSFEAYDQLKVLAVVDQTPQAGEHKPTDFIELCLNPFRERSKDPRALYGFNHIGMGDLLSEDLSEYELIVIADVTGISSTEAEQLEEYVKNGGGVLMFMGPKVNAEFYNTNVYRNGEGLFPWKMAEAKLHDREEDKDKPLVIIPDNRQHPIWQYLIEGKKNYMGVVRFYQTVGFEPVPNQRALNLAYAKKAADGDEEAKKLSMMAEFTFGRGRCLAIGSTADMTWNNFAARPAFVAFIQQAVKRLRMPKKGKRSYIAGDIAEMQVSWKQSQASFDMLDPAKEKRSISVLQEGDTYSMNIGVLTKSGFYRLQNTDNPTDVREFCVNMNQLESPIACVGAQELKKIYTELGVIVDETAELSEAFKGITASSDLATYCLLLALLFWIGENLLGYRITRRQV